jgi:hypothetical protein
MSEKQKKKFELVEMVLGFVVGLIIDGIAFIGDFFSFGFLGWLVQGVLWPFIKNFWLNKGGGGVLKDPLMAYVIPILVQGIPVLPTMCATIVVVMYLENHPEKLGIISKRTQVSGVMTTKGVGAGTPKAISNTSKITGESAAKIQKPTTGTPLPNTNKPRVLSMPSSPVRTQNNPIIQEHNKENEEQETIRRAA